MGPRTLPLVAGEGQTGPRQCPVGMAGGAGSEIWTVGGGLLMLSITGAMALIGVSPAEAAQHGESTPCGQESFRPSWRWQGTLPTFQPRRQAFPSRRFSGRRPQTASPSSTSKGPHRKTLRFPATKTENGNQYRAVFANSSGTAMTAEAHLTVTLRALRTCRQIPHIGVNLVLLQTGWGQPVA